MYLVVIDDVEPPGRVRPRVWNVEVGDEGCPARGTCAVHDGRTLHTGGCDGNGAADEARTTNIK